MVLQKNPKNFQGRPLQKSRNVNTRSAIVNTPPECLPPALTTSIQSQNTSSSSYMDNNNIYQGWIQKNTDYKDSGAKQGSSDSYLATTGSITKYNEKE